MQLAGRLMCCVAAPVNSGYRMPRSPAMPAALRPQAQDTLLVVILPLFTTPLRRPYKHAG